MPSRSFNVPAEVLDATGRAGWRGLSRRTVLTAAVRAACAAPPPAPVAYPTLTTAARSVSLPLSEDLHRSLRAVEASRFYGRTAWLVFYALVHHADAIEQLLRLDAEALAEHDRLVLQRAVEVSTCPVVPLSTRAPRAPRQPRRPKN